MGQKEFYEAAKNYPTDLDRLAEKGNFKREELENCPECDEPVENGGCVIYPFKKSCATFQCGACGSIVDKWAEKVISE